MLAQAARIFIPNTIHGPVGNIAPGGDSPAPVPTTAARCPRTAGIPDDIGPVLAQIPDLDPKTAPTVTEKLLDGRIISQALSLKMVFGLAIGLIVGAVLPFLLRRSGTPKQVRELPAFNTQAAEQAGANERTLAPKWQPAAPSPAVASQAATMSMMPPPPPLGNYRPAALTPPSWTRPQTSAASPPVPQPANNLNQDYARGNPLPGPPDARAYGYGPPAQRRDFGAPAERVADRRNDPATAYRNPPGNEYRGNSVDPAAVRSGPAYGVPGDDRYRATPDAAARQDGPLAPPPGYGAGGDYRYQQDNDDGVAHFNGTITAPSGRTNP